MRCGVRIMSGNGLPTIHASMAYRDCAAGIRWLTRVRGFTRHLVMPGGAGRIDHVELRAGKGPVMLSSASEDGLDWLGAPPGPANLSLVAGTPAAVDPICARVTTVGGQIVRGPGHSDSGACGHACGFTCLHPESTRWTVATYQPAGGHRWSRNDLCARTPGLR